MPNSYSNLGFRLELDKNNWSSSFGIRKDNADTLSALLHEYIHYLQDTCTYYGSIYRREAYDDGINRDIKGATPDELFDVIPKAICDSTGCVTYGPCRVGSLLIKESMATVAQRYVFHGDVNNIQIGDDYNIATNYILGKVPCLRNHELLLFALMDILLMTEDPGRNLVILVSGLREHDIEALLRQGSDEDLLADWYDLCENQILVGLTCYEKVLNLELEGDYWAKNTIKWTGGILVYPNTYLSDNEELLIEVDEKLRSYYCNNMNKQRMGDHAIVSRVLAAFARGHCMNDFYNMFGFPIIVCPEDSSSNIEMFLNPDYNKD